MGKYFGTDGFRGVANENITADHAYKIGRFIGWYFNQLSKGKSKERARILIGKDTRRSSYMFENCLIAGAISSGADVYRLHVSTTPSVAYLTRTNGFDCGIMITASHNPFYDNGIKILDGQGAKMDEETISLIEDYIDGSLDVFGKRWSDVPFAKGEDIGKVVDFEQGKVIYTDFLTSLCDFSLKGKKVGLDCANGSAFEEARRVFENLGATVSVINDKPDGCNVNLNAGSTHIEGLQKLVKDEALDFGFAFDGDADRCLAVDENGNVVNGDAILYACGIFLKENGSLKTNTVVTTVMSNFGLYKALDKVGIEYAKTAVGDKYVFERMRECGDSIGGEQSGHIIFADYATTGDGILTAVMVSKVIVKTGKSLSALVKDLKFYPQTLINVKVTDKKEAQEDEDVQNAVNRVAKILGDSGRILVRESGTERLVRVMVEAEKEEVCKKLAQSVVDVIIAKGYERK